MFVCVCVCVFCTFSLSHPRFIYVYDITMHNTTSFVHMSGGKHRGKPTFFVSHAWKADGVGLLDAIVTHGDEEVKHGRPLPVYYLDLACVDQHQVDQVCLDFDTSRVV